MIRGRKAKGLISSLDSLNCLSGLVEDSLTAEDVLYKYLSSEAFLFIPSIGMDVYVQETIYDFAINLFYGFWDNI